MTIIKMRPRGRSFCALSLRSMCDSRSLSRGPGLATLRTSRTALEEQATCKIESSMTPRN
eukprot:CAMPEP_0181176524 /NCGR_PEP_ID=MMETSP1096-20121128/4677_1 /TAXON_ID=156174 ORGANISM="Chrysochromulina ericina, Strain CCMP281" /NCGR_SAMPLE_ID=MMETSP1096 /ASSEMBLY_ACC=CAM_ASM_000453 /LENGTH=59 /DNA_ID=CAMNT_0023264621 /DNA_START=410 /DNA_END=586 /DNA_ORIENTATION=-